MLIYVDPSAAIADVIRVDGDCYRRLSGSDQGPNVFADKVTVPGYAQCETCNAPAPCDQCCPRGPDDTVVRVDLADIVACTEFYDTGIDGLEPISSCDDGLVFYFSTQSSGSLSGTVYLERDRATDIYGRPCRWTGTCSGITIRNWHGHEGTDLECTLTEFLIVYDGNLAINAIDDNGNIAPGRTVFFAFGTLEDGLCGEDGPSFTLENTQTACWTDGSSGQSRFAYGGTVTVYRGVCVPAPTVEGPDPLDVAAEADVYSVWIDAAPDCAWTLDVSDLPEWVELLPTASCGPTTVNVTIGGNDTGVPRTCTIPLSGGGSLTINQAA